MERNNVYFHDLVKGNYGRKIAYTDVEQITRDNIIDVIGNCIGTFYYNKPIIKYLWKYYKGDQPVLYRTKVSNEEICNSIVENHSYEIVQFKVGQTYGEPVQFVSRKDDDRINKAVDLLNDYMVDANKQEKDIKSGEWQSATGTSFKAIQIVKDDELHFRIVSPNPLNTFIIYNRGTEEPLFKDLGITLSSTLNTVVYSALNFAGTLKWDEIGRNIAGGITAAFENWDAASTAQAINKWVQGVFDLITSAITNVDWMTVYDKITEFLENIDIKTIAIVVGAVTIKKIGKVAAKVGLANLIGNAISKMTKKVPIIIESLKIIASGGVIDESGILSKIANVISKIVGGAVKLTEWNEVNKLLTITFGKLATNLTGIGTVISGVTMVGINFFSMWKDGFSWLKEALLVAGSGIIALGAIILGATAPVALLVAGAVAGVATIAVVVHDNWEKIQDFTSSLIENIKNFFSPLVDFVNNNVIEPITRRFNQFKDGISIIFQAIDKVIKGVWNAVSTAVYKTFIQPAIDRFNGFKEATKQIFDAIKMAIHNAYDGSIVQRFVNAAKETLQGLGIFISNWASIIGGGITSLFKVILNSIIWLFEKGINSPIDAVNTFLKGFNNIVSVAAKITGNKWGGVDLIPKVSLPRFENGGYPEVGDLFFANEHGIPELVGTMNGKPAVGSGQEITGISNAVYSTSQEELAVMRELVSIGRQLLQKDFSTHIGDRDIARANRRGEKQMGLQIIY